jgi:hypothetical protein
MAKLPQQKAFPTQFPCPRLATISRN